MLVGSLAASWFPVALSALWMPAPHITVHSWGLSCLSPGLFPDVGGCMGCDACVAWKWQRLTLPGQPALEVEWELVNNCSGFLRFGLTIQRFIHDFQSPQGR